MSMVVLSDPETGIWGCGQTDEDAAEDLQRAFAEHRSVLEAAEDSLAPSLQRQLAILRSRDGEA